MSGIPTDPFQWLLYGGGIGALAFLVVAFIRGWVVPRSSLDMLIQARDRAWQREDKMAPMIEGLAEELRALTAEMRELTEQVERWVAGGRLPAPPMEPPPRPSRGAGGRP